MKAALKNVATGGHAAATGQVSLTVIRGGRRVPAPPPETTWAWLRRALHSGLPTSDLLPPEYHLQGNRALVTAYRRDVNRFRIRNMKYLLRGMRKVLLARGLGVATFYGSLELEAILKIGTLDQRRYALGLVSLRVVTNNGVGFIVDAFQNLTELENMKFHGLGTGSTAEDATDAALVTELTTQYTGNVRATGNLAEGASANIFHTEATNTLDETPGAALREHGVFSASSSGVLLDRSVYGALTLSSGDGLLSKYELTHAAGG